MNTINRILLLGVTATMLSACASQAKKDRIDGRATDEIRITATPKATPQQTITNFTRSLRCMDDLFQRYDIGGLVIGAQDVPDMTDIVSAGTKDMLITALSTMSIKSKAIRFVALGQDLEDITRFHTLHKRKQFKAPDFFIRGAITQADQGVVEKQVGGGLAWGNSLSLEVSKDRIASIVSLDMNMGLVSNLQMLPGVSSSNSIAVVRKGAGADLTGKIKKLGALFYVDFTESEGLHHATRTLVELSAIELMGRLTQVPYWECLNVETTNTLVQRQVQDWYHALEKPELTKFVQAKLNAMGQYEGPIDGESSEDLSRAITLFKAEQKMIANNSLDFALYYALMADQTPIAKRHIPILRKEIEIADVGAEKKEAQVKRKVIEQVTQLERVDISPLELTLSTEQGNRPTYSAGESATLEITTSLDAYVYCFYQTTAAEIVKIFPNQFTENPRLQANRPQQIPGDDNFSIQFDQPNSSERVMCMASYKDIEKKLHSELRAKNLQPISLAQLSETYKRQITSLDDVYAIYKGATNIVPLRKSLTMRVR